LAVLQQVCANDVDVPIGKLIYTQWLNERGGIEADLTVTRVADDCFFIVTAAATQRRDFHWLQTRIPVDAHAVLTDITSAYAVLSVMGPNARQLLAPLTPADLSNTGFPFGTSQEIELGYALVRASRISFVGELGWELYISTEFATGVYDTIVDAGSSLGMRHAGYHALNSLRMEKAYRHWGHDITVEDSPLEAGLGFAVALDKPGGFIGRDALLQQKQHPLKRRMVQFVLDDPQSMLYHEEPIWRDGVRVGRTTSAMYGHTLGASVALGYVENDEAASADYINAGSYEIEVGGERFSARASLRPMYDPKAERTKL
jgi:4-methylaminobutanoate oxidase (formaldehyde-forming)